MNYNTVRLIFHVVFCLIYVSVLYFLTVDGRERLRIQYCGLNCQSVGLLFRIFLPFFFVKRNISPPKIPPGDGKVYRSPSEQIWLVEPWFERIFLLSCEVNNGRKHCLWSRWKQNRRKQIVFSFCHCLQNRSICMLVIFSRVRSAILSADWTYCFFHMWKYRPYLFNWLL